RARSCPARAGSSRTARRSPSTATQGSSRSTVMASLRRRRRKRPFGSRRSRRRRPRTTAQSPFSETRRGVASVTTLVNDQGRHCAAPYTDAMAAEWPLVGRDAELRTLKHTLVDRRQGVVLAGPVGVGKSRLFVE